MGLLLPSDGPPSPFHVTCILHALFCHLPIKCNKRNNNKIVSRVRKEDDSKFPSKDVIYQMNGSRGYQQKQYSTEDLNMMEILLILMANFIQIYENKKPVTKKTNEL